MDKLPPTIGANMLLEISTPFAALLPVEREACAVLAETKYEDAWHMYFRTAGDDIAKAIRARQGESHA